MESNPSRNSNANRNSRDGSHRMHPYNSGNNSFGRGKNNRGRNQNMRNDFHRGKLQVEKNANFVIEHSN